MTFFCPSNQIIMVLGIVWFFSKESSWFINEKWAKHELCCQMSFLQVKAPLLITWMCFRQVVQHVYISVSSIGKGCFHLLDLHLSQEKGRSHEEKPETWYLWIGDLLCLILNVDASYIVTQQRGISDIMKQENRFWETNDNKLMHYKI